MAMKISVAIFFTNTKWPWKFPCRFLESTKWPWKFPWPFFLQIQNGHGNFHVNFWQAQNNFYGHFSYKHKMAVEISKAIFFLQTLNGHGNFHVSFWQAQNGHGNFHGHFLFTPMLTKGRVYNVVAGGGRVKNDHGHFCVFSAELLRKIQRILSIRYFFGLARPGV